MNELVRPWLLVAGLLLASKSGWAQPAAPPAPAPAKPEPTPTQPPAVPIVPAATTPTREQRIDERTAVTLALRNNPDYRASELNIQQAKQGVLSEEGAYPYFFDANAGFTRSERPSLGANDSVRSSVSRTYNVGSGLRRTFPYGTRAEVRVDGSRFENDTTSTLPGASSGSGYGVVGRAAVTQPLMRGFGTTVGEVGLRAARVSRTVAEKTHRQFTSQLVRDVLGAYWELWFATESVQIEQAALDLAKRQEEEANARVKIGALSLAELLTFQTRVAQLEESVVSADVTKRQRSLDLGQRMGSFDESTPQFVAATPPPNVASTATRADVEAALRSGSIELAALEAQVRLARTRAEAAGEGNRPRLDLEGFVESEGVSERVPRAFERAGRMGWITAHVGAVFELPLDNTQLNAERTIALLAVRSAETNLRAARERILADATFAVTTETAAHQRFTLAERTLAVAHRAWEAEKARFELGNSIPITVQQAEDELRRARLRVARARVDVAQAQVAVLHLAGKLVGRYSSG